MIKDYVALDLETTGLSPVNDRILEIGAIRVRDGQEEARLCTLVDCGMRIPERISALTGITNEMLEEARSHGSAPQTAQAVRELTEFCEELPLLGHNIIFDYGFVRQHAANHGMEFCRHGIDTLKIAKRFLGVLPSRRLEALCDHYHIETRAHHRAVEDALAAAKLYGRLSEEFETMDAGAFLPQELIYSVKKMCPATKFQKAYLIDLVKYHRIALDVPIDGLTKNEASRLIDRIILTYGRIRR
ncbi:MAG: 3'-5' exonuclease [Eubacteriales bacterium]|nr:3'-5' exonuclease [Eubacteriales bacterium]